MAKSIGARIKPAPVYPLRLIEHYSFFVMSDFYPFQFFNEVTNYDLINMRLLYSFEGSNYTMYPFSLLSNFNEPSYNLNNSRLRNLYCSFQRKKKIIRVLHSFFSDHIFCLTEFFNLRFLMRQLIIKNLDLSYVQSNCLISS